MRAGLIDNDEFNGKDDEGTRVDRGEDCSWLRQSGDGTGDEAL